MRTLSALQQASAQLTVARTSLEVLKATVLPAAERAYDAAKFGFLDVLDAQRSLLAARARYLGTLSDACRSATAIDRLLGR